MKGASRAAVPSLAAAFALANLYLLSIIGPLVSPGHELIFHLPGSATLLFLSTILDVLVVTAVLTAALLIARSAPRLELLLWSALLLALPSGLLMTIYGFRSMKVPRGLGWTVAAFALLAFFLINSRPKITLPWFNRVHPALFLSLRFLAIPSLLMFLQLLWFGWQVRNLNPPFLPAPPSSAALAGTPHPTRVVWILLDELSFDQVYGHRYPGLQLPNFDRLASQSALFTHVIPAADYTRRAIPSMLTGLPLSRTQPSADGQTLTLYPAATRAGHPLDPQDTVFGDAQRVGLQTSVVGWYEPYCRLLPRVLNRCFWTYSDELPGGLTDSGGSLGQHLLEPFLHFLRVSFRPAGIGPVMPTHGALDVSHHRADYEALLAASDSLLTGSQSGLILIHMPIPHPWGFYDRHTGTFPNHRTSYLDNLALADAYIGRVRAQLEVKGLWDETNLLVTGDHSWRTATVWANSAHWTAEEQAASHGGVYDERPAYLLKLANQKAPSAISTRFNAVRTRSLLDRLIAGQITTPDELERWVATP